MRAGQSTKKRPVFVNNVLCVSMNAGARYSSKIIGRKVHLWEIQRLLSGKKRIEGLTVRRAD